MKNKKSAVVVFLLCLFLGVVALLVTLVMYSTNPMTDTIQNQLAALRASDINKAYSYLASETTATVSLDDFKNYITRYPIMATNISASFPEKKFENDKGYAKGTLKSADGKKSTAEYLLTKENGQWKIVAIHVYEESTALTEKNGSNNIYHDPTNHYTIEYPGNWTYEQPDEASVAFSGNSDAPSSFSIVTIQMIPVKGKGGKYKDAQAAIDDLKDQIHARTTKVKISDTGAIEVPTDKRIHGESFIATYTYKGYSMKKMQFVVSGGKDDMLYSWSYVTSAELYDKDLPIAKAMYESWKIK